VVPAQNLGGHHLTRVPNLRLWVKCSPRTYGR